MKNTAIERIIKTFIEKANAFEVEKAVELFTDKAVIDDVSVGRKFKNTAGVRDYLETYFVGYNTHTKLEGVEITSNTEAKAKVDFTGNFGHETGVLDVKINAEGLITFIAASLD